MVSVLYRGLDFTFLQWTTAIILAIDVRSGLITNKIYSAWSKDGYDMYQTDQKVLPIFHLHTVVIDLVFNYSPLWSIFWLIMLNVSVWLVNQTKIYNRRHVSIFITIIAIVINVVWIRPPQVFEWVVPLLFVNNVITPKRNSEPSIQKAY